MKRPEHHRCAGQGSCCRLFALTAAAAALLLPAAAAAQEAKEAAKLVEFFRPSGFIPTLIILAAAIVLMRLINAGTRRFTGRFADRRLLAQQVGTVLRFLLYILTVVLVVRSLFKLERETVLALTGTLAVAIGFALKDLAASVLAGITILFDRPFQVGDRLTFGGTYGEVSSIGLRSVRMVTLDDSLVTIPNNKFLTDMVISGNAGALDMQVVMDFYVAQDIDVSQAKRIVEESVRTSRYVFLEKPVVVLVTEVVKETYLATRLRAKAYVIDVKYEKLFESDVTERVKEGFAAAGVARPVRSNATESRSAASAPSTAADAAAARSLPS